MLNIHDITAYKSNLISVTLGALVLLLFLKVHEKTWWFSVNPLPKGIAAEGAYKNKLSSVTLGASVLLLNTDCLKVHVKTK